MQLFFFCFFENEKNHNNFTADSTETRLQLRDLIVLPCICALCIKEVLKQIHHFQLMLADSNMSKLKCPGGNALIVLVPHYSVLVIILYQKTDQKRQKKRERDLLVVFIASSVN